ncbi:MAG: hypothetical protein GTN93_03340 [Anaerolineae bacterium]|nr:hypothetical protein [Anaerolineae bacterium]
MGRVMRLCVLVWLAGALVLGLFIPFVPFWVYYRPGAELPARHIHFGSAMHLTLSAALVLVVAPAAGLCTGFLAWKWMEVSKGD